MAFDPELHQLILFGGEGAGGQFLERHLGVERCLVVRRDRPPAARAQAPGRAPPWPTTAGRPGPLRRPGLDRPAGTRESRSTQLTSPRRPHRPPHPTPLSSAPSAHARRTSRPRRPWPVGPDPSTTAGSPAARPDPSTALRVPPRSARSPLWSPSPTPPCRQRRPRRRDASPTPGCGPPPAGAAAGGRAAGRVRGRAGVRCRRRRHRAVRGESAGLVRHRPSCWPIPGSGTARPGSSLLLTPALRPGIRRTWPPMARPAGWCCSADLE